MKKTNTSYKSSLANTVITLAHTQGTTATQADTNNGDIMRPYLHKQAQEFFNMLFGVHELREYPAETKEEYITTYYEDIARSVIRCVARAQVPTKDGRFIPATGALACYEIVKSGFTDSIFNDLKQEIAICLWENQERLYPACYVKTHNHTFSITDVYIDCIKCVRNYLYNNKQRDEKYCVISGINEYTITYNQFGKCEGGNDIETVANSIEDRQNVLDNADFSIMVRQFTKYLQEYAKRLTEKQRKSMLTVWQYMQEYATQKQIASISGIASSTVNDYHKRIVKLWEEFNKETKEEIALQTPYNKAYNSTYFVLRSYYMEEKHGQRAHSVTMPILNGIIRHYNVDTTVTGNVERTAYKHNENRIVTKCRIATTFQLYGRDNDIKVHNNDITKVYLFDLWKESTK